MISKLPGQQVKISPALKNLQRQVEEECARNIVFSGVPMADFLGRTEWKADDILIEVQSTLTNDMAEYIAAHELGHALQLSRGGVIAGGRIDEPMSVEIATGITDFLYDAMADSLAAEFGLPMASLFQAWIQSTRIIDALNNPRRGRIFGDDWQKVWDRITEARVRKKLGLVPLKPTRDYWTIYVTLDLAKLSCRATNLGLKTGEEILEKIKRVRLVAKIVSDLIEIGPIRSVNESMDKIQAISSYFKVVPGHIFMSRPVTNEIMLEGKWQQYNPDTDSNSDID